MIVDFFAGPGGYVDPDEPMCILGPCLSPPPESWPNGNGYFRLTVDGVRDYAHRRAYMQLRVKITDGLVPDHLCRNRWCCNPFHLEAVTQDENKRRGMSPPAVNARKERCPQGHEYTVQADGTRRCMICRYERRVASGELSGRGHQAGWDMCSRGHPFDGENTYLVRREDGTIKQRMCKTCMREGQRRRRAAAKGVMPDDQ